MVNMQWSSNRMGTSAGILFDHSQNHVFHYRCGQETRVIPRILQMRSHWLRSQKESLRLEEAGLSKEVLDSAIAAFCLEIIARHGDPAPRLCNKDPLTLKSAAYLAELFPEAKFIFMIRDGRATVHSIISRKVTITGFDLTSYRQCLIKWNAAIQVMHTQCREVGTSRCLMVPYEQLVLHPRDWMQKILHFLDVPWNESVLHHEELINKPGGVSLSNRESNTSSLLADPTPTATPCLTLSYVTRDATPISTCDTPLVAVERSSDQVIKPVNLEALSKWVGHIPDDVVQDMAEIAPMLSVLGYDPYANPPKYGSPDSAVADNTKHIRSHEKLWENKAKDLLSPNRVFHDVNLEDSASEGPAPAA
ncbi:hypothetical protein PR048_026302 [Dryococelus australis]|uniref:Protein-tyrosine sulfotransferase n=1 Tax=Dryococelus australis TaxID=614101 RepID=A0ABQ9GKX9_9NEOP|nr:hypothetical protein PR048_026302 [Dryococelus australis]